ncbi:phage capsid protein [Bacillus sp. FJAT-22058]|nr:phage capsid protein [Bacillus sp. FJAT-22058]
MQENKETPERKRERLRQEELKRNPTGSLNDAFNKANSGGLTDLVGSLGWKGTGILILVIIIGFIFVSLFFK